jgi:hypothetical protein
MIGTPNNTVRAARMAAAARLLAVAGKRRRKALAHIDAAPMGDAARRLAYRQGMQRADYTPAQRRRLRKKRNRAMAHPRIEGTRPVLTEFDETKESGL